jgi:hypothetical protein
MVYLGVQDTDWVTSNIKLFPEYGSWLDLVKLWHLSPDNKVKNTIMDTIITQLNTDKSNLQTDPSKVSLLAKWLPSENSKWDRYTKERFNIELCKDVFSTWRVDSSHLKTFRKEYISPLRKQLSLVETYMCQKRFGEIDYEKVPSVAMQKYRKAFLRNDMARFDKYLVDVNIGKAKINSSQVYPHDLVSDYLNGYGTEDPVIEAQWKDIKARVTASKAFEKSIAVVDVSSSMSGTPMAVAIALGLLSLNTSNNNNVLTFSQDPKLHYIPDDSLFNQVNNIMRMHWGMNTNFEKVMQIVLDMIKNGGTPIERIYIFSDMQFDKAIRTDSTHFEMIKTQFEEANLTMPTIVFWNLRANTPDVPVSCNEHGVIMISGYSPSLLTCILDKDDITPLSMMFKIIRGPRYNAIVVPS